MLRSCPAKAIVSVVDDDARIRESVGDLLTAAGYEPRLFSCAEDLFRNGDLGGSSCLITDIAMPGMNGWELRQRVKDDFPELSVVVMTGQRDVFDSCDHPNRGYLPIIYKPFRSEELLSAVGRAIDYSRT